MDEIAEVFHAIMASIVCEAYRVAALPAEAEERELAASQAAHFDAMLDLGHGLDTAEGMAQSAARWTKCAVAIIREHGTLDIGPMH